ncbi:MAG TPA: glycosyltransferase family 4 protein [Anaerolineae bacterium]|nr:glycosyltransferase family 4 protein [Anaerolineae bacterium]
MRVLMVSKACLVGAYQTKLEAIGQMDGVELAVVVPPRWLDPAGEVPLERSHTEGYTLWVDPMRFNGSFHLHYYPQLKKRLAQFKPDIVHMDEEPYNLATWLGVRQGQKVGAKTLFFSWQNLSQRYPPPFRWWEQAVLKQVDYAIMGNQASVKVWQGKGYEGRHQVIPQFGVSPEVFVPPARRDEGRGFVIGAAGRRLVPEKGIDLLLRAVAKLPGMWRLHIAGEGPEKRKLEALAEKLQIRERVFFDGAIGSTEMPSYLQNLDVLVLPSRSLPNWEEQFGRVLIEAMACEVAVVGSDSGEIPHVIGEAGLVFVEDDEEGLRGQLEKLMRTEGLRAELGRKGREHVLAQYTQEQVARQTVAVYEEMMGLGA